MESTTAMRRWTKRLLIVTAAGWALIALAVSCAHRQRQEFSAPVREATPLAREPVQAGDAARYADAARYSVEHGGLSLVIVHGDAVVFEHYKDGTDPDQPHHLYSGTKSFSCALAAAAIADGKLSLQERVADTFPEWATDARKDVTVEQLLGFSSGLEHDFFGMTWDGLKKPEHQRVRDKYARALSLELEDPPGARFSYGNAHLMVFGALMKKKLGESPLSYLQRRVFEPIGMQTGGWLHDAEGNPALPYGAWTSARQWARFGMLIRDGGAFGGEQILPRDVIEKCSEPSAAFAGYGLTFWLNRPIPPEQDRSGIPRAVRRRLASERQLILAGGPPDLFMAAGHEDQRLYIVPSKNLVVARLSEGDRGFRDHELLTRLLRP